MKVFTIVFAVISLIICFILLISMGWINVHPTEVAVQINKMAGTVESVPLGVGYQVFNRWKTDMQVYDCAVKSHPEAIEQSEQSKSYTLDLKTRDGQNVNIDLTVLVSLSRSEVPKLHQEVGPLYVQQVLLPQLRSESRIIIGGYAAEERY